MEVLQQHYSRIQSCGASLVSVSPQLPEHSRSVVAEKNLTFDLLCDPGNRVADSYRIRFTLPESERDTYRSVGLDLTIFHGDDDWSLPLPARFVIDQEGIIRDAAVQADHTVRPDPASALEVLRGISSSG